VAVTGGGGLGRRRDVSGGRQLGGALQGAIGGGGPVAVLRQDPNGRSEASGGSEAGRKGVRGCRARAAVDVGWVDRRGRNPTQGRDGVEGSQALLVAFEGLD
jgi:hypothetical protein